jgi:hypothetical protein
VVSPKLPASSRWVWFRLRHPEVGHQSVAIGEHHIVWLDVAVNDVVFVSVCQGIDDVPKDPHGLADG